MTQEARCPVAGMVPFEREFLAKCHAEAHHRSVKAGEPPVPCVHCRLKTSRTARYSMIEDVADAEEILKELRDEMLDELDAIERSSGSLAAFRPSQSSGQG